MERPVGEIWFGMRWRSITETKGLSGLLDNTNGSHPVANMIAPFFAHFALANGFVQYMIRDVDSDRERMR
ncbi:MAG: hypothetical protein V4796_00160 [Burkholderia cenocepacia]